MGWRISSPLMGEEKGEGEKLKCGENDCRVWGAWGFWGGWGGMVFHFFSTPE